MSKSILGSSYDPKGPDPPGLQQTLKGSRYQSAPQKNVILLRFLTPPISQKFRQQEVCYLIVRRFDASLE